MIVIDASALVDVLLGISPRAPALVARIASEDLQAPELIDLEVASSMRGIEARNAAASQAVAAAMGQLSMLALTRHSHASLMPRVWQMRANLTPYDAIYVALAESLGVPFVTCDARIAAAPGHFAHVEVF